MTRNPYAQPQAEPPFSFSETQRTSALAVTSLVLSILGLLSCPVMVLGVLGFLSGVVGLYFISTSSGRLAGRGLALTGVIVGLLSIVVGMALWIGGAQLIRAAFAEPAQSAMQAIEAQDRAGIRALLEPNIDRATTDAQIDAFLASAAAATGSFQKIETGFISFITAMMEFAKLPSTGGRVDNHYAVWARTGNGRALVVMKIDEGVHSSSGSFSVAGAVLDFGVIVNGTEVWIQGPASPAPAPGTP